MFFKRVDWASQAFPRELFHDSRSKRGGVLMHSKVRPPTVDLLVRVFTNPLSLDDPWDTATQAATPECPREGSGR